MDVKQMKDSAVQTLSRLLPDILTGLGVASFFAAIGLAVVNTPRAERKIEALRKKAKKHRLPVMDMAKETWREWTPVAAAAAVGTGCIIGGMRTTHKRTAALTAAYTLSENALRTYKDQVVSVIGEKKEEAVRQKAAAEKARAAEEMVLPSAMTTVPRDGEVLCFDVVSGRYFYSRKAEIEAAQNRINHRLRSEMYISLNEFYDELNNRDLCHISIGNDIGWNADNPMDMYLDGKLEEDGRLVLVMDYGVLPEYRFR